MLLFSFIRRQSILTRSTPFHCDAALFFSIVTRIVNIACVNCFIEIKTSYYKVSVTITEDCNVFETLEVMLAPWNLLCVFNICIGLSLILFDKFEIANCISIFDHSRHSASTRLIGYNNFSLTPSFNRHFLNQVRTSSSSHSFVKHGWNIV